MDIIMKDIAKGSFRIDEVVHQTFKKDRKK